MCEGQAKLYLERTIPSLFGRELAHSKLWTMVDGERYFDVHQVQDTDTIRRERFYFDVSAYFDKPSLSANTLWRDLPEPHRTYPLTQFFSREELYFIAPPDNRMSRPWIDEYTVKFKQFSSEQIGQRIATLSTRSRSIEVAPVRMYMNQEIPFLHGYRFYKLFMVHQIAHWQQGHDPRLTELGPRRDGRRPRPGLDCVAFKPLKPYDFARDFLNFMFWNHQPDAFDDRTELDAFAETARFGIQAELFTLRELRQALGEAGLSRILRDRLRAALGFEMSRPRVSAPVERHVAH
jgi:hypothetical protein